MRVPFRILFTLLTLTAAGADASPRPKVPVMGWSSWNHYRIHINEQLIRAQADAMASNGMKEAGYRFVNIDDGFFGGRDANGDLVPNDKFVSGMRALSDHIHAKGLKAGIYTEAGSNTCGSQYDGDTYGIGSGLYGHEERDLRRLLVEWNYDFIKVDWCGGLTLGLSDKTQYTKIGGILRKMKPEVVYNVCRWQYPGDWVRYTGDSWRISGDIGASFSSVMSIVDRCEPLWIHSGPGRFNDMDMLQVGRGMSQNEDRTHFTLWCMMNSPLLAGNDLTTMSAATLAILTNPEIIALNQDLLCYQARRLRDDGNAELWAKPLKELRGGEVAVTLLNRGSSAATLSFNLSEVGLDPAAGYSVRDLWQRATLSESTTASSQTFTVPAHGVIALRLKGTTAATTPFASLPGWTYDAWCSEHGLPAEDAGLLADPDHDGLPNLLEYALDDGDPLVPNTGAPLVAGHENGKPLFRFSPRRTTDVTLVPQANADLSSTGGWQTIPRGREDFKLLTDASGEKVSVETTAGRMFFRLSADIAAPAEGVKNPGFESPAQAAGAWSTANPPGWTFSGLSGGVEHVNDPARYGVLSSFGTSPGKLAGQGGDGNQVGFVNLGTSTSGVTTASATSGNIGTIEPDTTYTLTIAFGQRTSGGTRLPNGRFGLRTGTTDLGDFTSFTGSTLSGGFHDLTYTWTSPGEGDPRIGRPLVIRMDFTFSTATGNWQQAQFDRVRFSHSP